jgi:hypothetical protein
MSITYFDRLGLSCCFPSPYFCPSRRHSSSLPWLTSSPTSGCSVIPRAPPKRPLICLWQKRVKTRAARTHNWAQKNFDDDNLLLCSPCLLITTLRTSQILKAAWGERRMETAGGTKSGWDLDDLESAILPKGSQICEPKPRTLIYF